MLLDNTAEVETPEHVRFQYRVAGPTRRALAWLVDFLIRSLSLGILAVLIRLAVGGAVGGDGFTTGVVLVIAFVLEWGYYVAFETLWSGRTPGKRLLGLRTIMEGGYPLGFVDSLLRNLLRAADFLPAGYALGLCCMAADRRFRRLGDRVAGTMVVLEEPAILPRPLVLSPPATPEELSLLPPRLALGAFERESLELFLRRRDLGPARRQELAEMVAPPIGRRLGVPRMDPVRFLALIHDRLQSAHRARPGR